MKDADGRSEKVYRGARGAKGIVMESTVLSDISTELKLRAYGRNALSRIHPRIVSSLRMRRNIMASGTSLPDFIVDSAWMPTYRQQRAAHKSVDDVPSGVRSLTFFLSRSPELIDESSENLFIKRSVCVPFPTPGAPTSMILAAFANLGAAIVVDM
jgi:hypothetical protein